jgi:transposase
LDGWQWPAKGQEQERLAQLVGSDGFRLLDMLYAMAQTSVPDQDSATPLLYQLEAVQALRQLWLQQYYREGDKVQWRKQEELPPVRLQLQSPYDVEARWSYRRDDSWVGYKVHITESCEPNMPHLITDVQTRPSGEADLDALPTIHAALMRRGLLPAQQLVDAGYLTSKTSLQSEEAHAVELVGQIERDTSSRVARLRQG